MEGYCELCGVYGDVVVAYADDSDDADCRVVCADRADCEWNVMLAPLRPYEVPMRTGGFREEDSRAR